MTLYDTLLLVFIGSLQVGIFISGIFIGKFMCINIDERQTHPIKKTAIDHKKHDIIQIDDSKMVGFINTQSIEKKFDSITTQQEISTDISSSINKLKNMKG